MKRNEAGSKDSAGAISRPKKGKLQEQATPERRGTQSSKSPGACRSPPDEKPSTHGTEDGGPTKHNRDQINWRGSRREGTKIKLQAQTSEEGKANPDLTAKMDPTKGGTKKTRRPKHRSSQSSDSQGAAVPSTSRPNSEAGGNSDQRKKQDPKGRGKGASRESDKGKGLPSSTGKGQTSGKNQDHRPGKPDPKNRNAKSPTQQETQPPAGRAQKGGQKKPFPNKGNTLDLKTLKEKDCTEVVHKLNESMAGLKFILRSEEEQHITDDFIFDLTCTLATVTMTPGWPCNKPDSTIKRTTLYSAAMTPGKHGPHKYP